MKQLFAALVFMFGTGIANAGHLNVTLSDLLLLAESGVSDKTILAFIEPRELAFTSGTEEIAKLRKAGLSEEVIQYLLANNKQASLTDNKYIKSSVPSSYPRYYYGSSLYLGFGGGHHVTPHHTNRHHGSSFNTVHSGSTGSHQIGHSSYYGVSTASPHNTGINSNHGISSSNGHTAGLGYSHSIGTSHSTLGSRRHNISRSVGHSSRSSSRSVGHSSRSSIGHSRSSSRSVGHSSRSSIGHSRSRSAGH
jgi:hypothetical protein